MEKTLPLPPASEPSDVRLFTQPDCSQTVQVCQVPPLLESQLVMVSAKSLTLTSQGLNDTPMNCHM